MAEDLLHDRQALLLFQAAGRLNQNSSQVWADQRLWEALQPQLQGSSQLQAVQLPHQCDVTRALSSQGTCMSKPHCSTETLR